MGEWPTQRVISAHCLYGLLSVLKAMESESCLLVYSCSECWQQICLNNNSVPLNCGICSTNWRPRQTCDQILAMIDVLLLFCLLRLSCLFCVLFLLCHQFMDHMGSEWSEWRAASPDHRQQHYFSFKLDSILYLIASQKWSLN